MSAMAIAVAAATACQRSSEESREGGRWGDVRLVEEIRIGELEGPEEYLFGRIGSIAVGPEGSIYVADYQQVSIRQYDSAGQYVRAIGRTGEGPGEYRRILGMKTLPDGKIAVLDVPHRIILYKANGKYLNDFRVPSGLHAPRMLEYDLDGNLYVKSVDADDLRGTDDWPMVLIKMSPDGELLGRIPLPLENKSSNSFVLITPEGPARYFTVSTRHAWSPLGYLVVGRNDEYSIRLLRPDSTVTSIGRDIPPVPVESQEREMWRDWAAHMERGSGPGYPALPDVKPYFKDIYVGEDGRIWVHRHVAAQWRDLPPREPGDERPLLSWREPVTFDVFEPDGMFLGTVVLPKNSKMVVAKDRVLWGIVAGDDGEQVVRWRIEHDA